MDKAGARLSPLEPRKLASLYLTAKERVIDAGYSDEIDWQQDVSLDDLDEPRFLRESAWVVLSAGFRESILRRLFDNVSRAFLHWRSSDLILAQRKSCRRNALAVFGHKRKIDGILDIVELVASTGMDAIRCRIASQGTGFLRDLPYIGPVTACHLAKNLGMSMVKPDRHMTRIAARAGYASPDLMCRVISEIVGDSLSVIDIVMWRYATLSSGTHESFGDRPLRPAES